MQLMTWSIQAADHNNHGKNLALDISIMTIDCQQYIVLSERNELSLSKPSQKCDTMPFKTLQDRKRLALDAPSVAYDTQLAL